MLRTCSALTLIDAATRVTLLQLWLSTSLQAAAFNLNKHKKVKTEHEHICTKSETDLKSMGCFQAYSTWQKNVPANNVI